MLSKNKGKAISFEVSFLNLFFYNFKYQKMKNVLLFLLFIPLSILSIKAQNPFQRSVYFDKDKADIKTDGATTLVEVMNYLKQNPTFQIQLSGNADTDGNEEHNRLLSERRVQTIRQFLENKAISSSKIVAFGLGTSKPIANNATEEGKKQNRRVDIQVRLPQNTPSVSAPPVGNLNNLYRELATPIQSFKIQTNKDTIIQGEKGTVLFIPKNAFQGVPNSSIVDFKLKEAYAFSDMIRDNLNTMSGDKPLQTGGMIYTEANFNGQSLRLQRDLQVQFNSKESKLDGMQIFTGEKSTTGIDWKPSGITMQKEEVTTIYAAPSVAFRPYLILNEKTNKPISLKELCDTTGCSPLFIKENSGTGFTVRPDMSNVCGAMAMFVEARPNFPQSSSISDIHKATFFEIYEKYKVLSFDALKKQDSRIWDSLMTLRLNYITNAETANKMREGQKILDDAFPVPNLGWINCDMFSQGGLTQVKFKHNLPQLNNYINYKIILKKPKMILTSSSTLDEKVIVNSNLPLNEDIIVLAIWIEDGQPFVAVEERTVTKDMEVKLNIKQMSTAEIKEKLKILDN